MNSETLAEVPPAAYCRTCGKGLSTEEVRQARGSIYCAEHVPPPEETTSPPPSSSPWRDPQPEVTSISPGLAFLLGLIPGVGAIYNGQYAKGLVHVVIFGLLVSILNAGAARDLEPLFGMLLGVWIFYMAFEAYHTAKKRMRGERVDEFSSIVPLQSSQAGFPAAPVILIAGGVIFLLINLDVIRLYQIVRYWPVFLIALGVYMLYSRISGDASRAAASRDQEEVSHER